MKSIKLLCPSAPYHARDAVVFGIVGGELGMPSVQYLEEILIPSDELSASLGGIDPGEVFRIASPCSRSCHHNDIESQDCKLAQRLVVSAPVKFYVRSFCAIRASCKWWRQEGADICNRCPQIVTRGSSIYPGVEVAARPTDLEAEDFEGKFSLWVKSDSGEAGEY